MRTSSYEAFVLYVRENGGYPSSAAAYAACERVLDGLGASLDARVARRIAIELPTPFGLILGGAHRDHDSLPRLDDLCERLAAQNGTRLCFAVIEVGVVLEAIGFTVRKRTLDALRAALPLPRRIPPRPPRPHAPSFAEPALPRNWH